MRFLTVAAVVSVVAVASAQTAKYPFKPDGPCVEACTLKEGKLLFPNFTHDENSPYWLESLGYDHDRKHPKYTDMMMKAGMCMGPCPLAEQELFKSQFQAKTEWYAKAKSGAGQPEPSAGTGGSSVAPTRPTGASVAPVPSGAHGSATAPAGGKPTEAPKNGAVSVASGMVGVAAALLSAVALL
ncbi:hypothetical protein BGZ70_000686 [Mortierella alpina]|uniref:Uncharacterized protein n=1 Tax=Mortierella alpina TaxID=64518 RepID=A0A9P6JCA0_MORAP|nr:hypothetical protein BGZ70_000686 [Mortierella alpina]